MMKSWMEKHSQKILLVIYIMSLNFVGNIINNEFIKRDSAPNKNN